MSIEKRNKGRDPASFLNDSPISRLVKKFIEMPETEYARNVVIPSLEAEGYERIDFHHGPTEIGKDLIFCRPMGYGKKELVVAVIKSDRLSKSASDMSGFPVFRVQLQQALENEVISWDGSKRRPDRVIVIFADDPSADIISSNPGGFQNCTQNGVQFILGSEIASSLIELRSDIAEQILETKLDAKKFFDSHPTNLPLLHALHENELIDIQTIFTDLDAAIGTMTIAKALSLKLAAKSEVILIEEDSWPDVSKILKAMENLFGKFLLSSIDDSERKFNNTNKRAKSEANKNILISINKAVEDIKSWAFVVHQEISKHLQAVTHDLEQNNQLDDLISGLISNTNYALLDANDAAIALKDLAIKIQKNRDIKNGVKELSIGIKKCFNSIDTAKSIIIKQDEIFRSRKSLSEIFNELVKSLKRESENAKDFTDNNVKLLRQGEKLVALTPYELHIDFQSLSHQIKNYIKALVSRFHSDQVSVCRKYSRQLLEDVKNCLIVLDNFLTNKHLCSVFVPFSQEDTNISGLSACILGLLDSGIDVLLSGNAGSGKSTTLEMFARRRFECRKINEEIIFLPLMKVATDIANDKRDPLISFCDEIARLFRSAQPGVTQKFIMERINTASQLVLIFDGIDEASGIIGWLLQLIIDVRQLKKGAVQIIASSRFGVIELENAGLIQIQLLPFRPEQVKRFVSDYLCNEPKLSEEVIQHLKRHPTMFSVAQTPMMSTILCVLAKNGVVLPETKNALYKERFELLWGAYDAKKQVHRVRSSRSCLEDVSKKIAYYLHGKRIRSASREDILLYIHNALNKKYRPEFIEIALKELEQPCNVLLVDVDEKIGFGHLSYQEYLVSEELYSNRYGDIVAHLADPWWRGVLVLTAMKTEDIGEIIEGRIIQMGVIGKAAETLKAMIEVCDEKQGTILSNYLTSQELLDYMDDNDNF